MVQKQNCVIWIQTVSWYTYKQMIFIKTLQKMLKQSLILQNYELKRPLPKEKNKKVRKMNQVSKS